MIPPRVLLFGSRMWDSQGLIRARLERFPRGSVVIHGAARGADTIGGEVAASLGFEVIEEPALWEVEGKAAGPKRNQRMIDLHRPTCGIGFLVEFTPGSMDMARRLVDARLPVDLILRPLGS